MDTCKNYQKCPIYGGLLADIKMASAAYRKNYCDAGEKGWTSCRRFQVKEKGGKVPENLLPNSHRSVEEIIKRYGMAPAAVAKPAPAPSPSGGEQAPGTSPIGTR